MVLLTGSAFSGFGDGLVAAAFPLLAAQQTDDALLIAGVLGAQRLPWVLFALHGGALVDRLPMRRFLPTVDLVRFVAVGLLAMAVAADLPVLIPLYLTALMVGTGDTIIASGLQSAVPRLVEDADLDRANARMYLSQAVTEHLGGPALGGVLFGIAAVLPFGVDALTFLVSAALMARALPGGRTQTPSANLYTDVRDGVRWFFSQPDLREMTLLIAAFSLLQGAVLSVLVILTEEALAGSSTTYGLVLASAAVGNLTGSLVTTRVARRFPLPAILFSAGVATGLGYVAMGLAPNAVVAAAGMVVEGVSIGIAAIAALTYRQRRMPTEMLGRGAAASRLVTFGVLPVGAVLAGIAASVVDIRVVFIGIGVLQVVFALVFTPRLSRTMDTAHFSQHQRG